MIQIQLPVAQEDIPKTMKLIADEFKRINLERDLLSAMARAVRSCCSHPHKTWCPKA
jgi:hypothetical protein